MSKSFDSYQKRRLKSSYFSVVISISLVLFMVGTLGLVLLKSNKIANRFKERVAISLFFKDGVTNQNVLDLKASLLEEKFTKKVIYVSKKTAAKTYSKEIGEDFLTFLGTNPLKNSVDIYLKANFVTPERMQEIEARFIKNAFIADVSYDKPMINLLTKSIKNISFWLFVISGFLGLIAIVLINSSIRLSIYSKRFNIKTMQLVGATKSFIRKPFIFRSIKLGMFGALLALIALGFAVYFIDKRIPSIELLQDYASLAYLAGSVVSSAFAITWLSTFFATQRYLNLKTDELYY